MNNDPIDNKLGIQPETISVPNIEAIIETALPTEPVIDEPVECEGCTGDPAEHPVPPEGDPGEAETSEQEQRRKVIEIQTVLGEQNKALLGQLRLIGKQPTPMMLIKLEHDVLLDFVFGEDGESREAYTTACHMQLNGELKRALGQAYGVEEADTEG